MRNFSVFAMSKSEAILLRVQSPEGTKRVEVNLSSSTSQLFEAVHDTFKLNTFAFELYKEKNKKNEIISSKSVTLLTIGIRHGDMIYLTPVNGFILSSSDNSSGEPIDDSTPSTSFASSNTRPSINSKNVSNRTGTNIEEDEVDLQLMKLDGNIERNHDEKLCRHNANSRCVHCSPLEPYDEAYLRELNIKHLSFHSYVRKMTSGVDRGKFLALEDMSCRIRNGCKDHPPWPKGICSKCQPNAITLNMQAYRHVDNVAFENTSLVENFLNYWRVSGHQRIGFLYGTYGIHTDVPLGWYRVFGQKVIEKYVELRKYPWILWKYRI